MLYKAVEEVMGACSQLFELIRAEKSHMVTLMKVALGDAKFGGLNDTWS